jgi:16S rRNA (guanine1207-N2)-methyltransferase
MGFLRVPQGQFKLSRYPQTKKETLQAWDAADEYLLQYLDNNHLPTAGSNILIVNDSFGALSVALATHKPTMLSDSWLAHQGTRSNLATNNIPHKSVTLFNSLQSPDNQFELILIKIPKTLALLEDQLHRIRPCLQENSRILGAGMTRNIHTSTLRLFERLIGPTKTSLAKKKARLIFSEPDVSINPGQSPYPTVYRLENMPCEIINHANVFAREKLDIGSRFLLENFPPTCGHQHIIDLGCGNGLLGLTAALKNPDATLTFVDESFMAVASARSNFHSMFGDTDRAKFITTDCLTGIRANSADLILNNPPFHQQSAVGDATAWRMFHQSRNVLKPSGELWVIGNRHLAYHSKLKRLFGNCTTIASNRKFVLLKAIAPTPQ